MKHLYKFLGLLFVFGLSLFLFGRIIPSASIGTTTATSLKSSTFPLLNLQLSGNIVNTLHGYSSELSSSEVRESITPLDTTKTFTALISENESSIKKLDYELRDISNNKVILSNTLSAFSNIDNYKTAKIKLDTALDTSTEYGFMLVLTTNYSKKIHFYTRIKYYDSDFYLQQKLDFVKKFHNATFKKGQSMDITNYLEPATEDDSTLAKVTIHSSYKMILWNKLKPTQISECIPTIKELNIETAAIEQAYFVKAKTASGTEIYQVKEFYRVRYSGGRIYLLYFQRTMESIYDPHFTSLSQSEFKVGITNEQDLNITTSSDNKKMAFVRGGSLWYYDLAKNRLDEVFTYQKKSTDYLRDYYDQHDIRILSMDDDGNISFVVYGYMNCGDYEGRVGILLYDYKPEDHQITERVYVPMETTYQKLKEDFGEYCYVNHKNIFYFSLNHKVYAYNISSKRYEVLTENATNENFAMIQEGNSFVWSDATQKKPASSMTIMNLDTEKKTTITAPDGQYVIVLGNIDNNVIYGFVKPSDQFESTDGETILPAYKMLISDCSGTVLKEYKSPRRYVVSATVEDNIIRLKRVKKQNGSFVPTVDDSVMNQETRKKQAISLTSRVTDTTLTEKYISLPAGFIMEKMPEVEETKYVLVTENTTIHLNLDATHSDLCYYVYAFGGITASTNNAGDAIQLADEQMGVVMDSQSHIVWERGGKFLSKTLSGITTIRTGGSISSIEACAQMLLESAQVTVSHGDLKGNTAAGILRKYLDTTVNLTGCTVDEVLYFVSNEKPVIAMTGTNHAVLITAYDTASVTWLDPSTGSKTKMSLANAETHFKNAGYIFISYINN